MVLLSENPNLHQLLCILNDIEGGKISVGRERVGQRAEWYNASKMIERG